MKSIEFKQLPLEAKWIVINKIMSDIASNDAMFSMRRRLNPHHSKKQSELETKTFRISQLAAWNNVKELYAEFRDELVDTRNNDEYIKCKEILERIFTQDLDDALRKTISK